ncbi:hypothetical protein M2459_001318 [Parabacteroides sp. PF5-5]|nr:hypothetical protein [Parabacteroides sp. PH5-39]MDH6315804.1 hypothetical protein [Parabacteroides sp. PF5-13]MDH6319463.1 hypothetical protein [Parabacteroides sp. PH5-13]MDH6323194.1 hypothetical protein [Parabacteroides sp. PH5-8]MDH6326996.1 hypothetical protein [Parabacteroides sp. PH5-41]MDH6334574.1 hypothetical protein [Parabacteroides sp. PF5-5]MDH6345639.1 hypothetical protein [Parabacteroides sp. PH5-46]MDH6360595.1 hypothetical protein [Parabacteroides sp. PH5-16]MDH6376484.
MIAKLPDPTAGTNLLMKNIMILRKVLLLSCCL